MATNIPVIEEMNEDKIGTVVADDLEIKGTIKLKSSVMLKGVFEGEIFSEGLLVVGPTAKVTATITAKTFISHGLVTGNVTAGEQVVLNSTATHNGDLKTPFLTIDNGAIFNGASVMERLESNVAAEEAPPASVSEDPQEPAKNAVAERPYTQVYNEVKQEPLVIARQDSRKRPARDGSSLDEPEKTDESASPTENSEP